MEYEHYQEKHWHVAIPFRVIESSNRFQMKAQYSLRGYLSFLKKNQFTTSVFIRLPFECFYDNFGLNFLSKYPKDRKKK